MHVAQRIEEFSQATMSDKSAAALMEEIVAEDSTKGTVQSSDGERENVRPKRGHVRDSLLMELRIFQGITATTRRHAR